MSSLKAVISCHCNIISFFNFKIFRLLTVDVKAECSKYVVNTFLEGNILSQRQDTVCKAKVIPQSVFDFLFVKLGSHYQKCSTQINKANIYLSQLNFFQRFLQNFLWTLRTCSGYRKGPPNLDLYISKKIVTARHIRQNICQEKCKKCRF